MFGCNENCRCGIGLGLTKRTVTIYEDAPGDICSGTQVENVDIASCWNSTYVFYSIDFCDPGAANSSPSPSTSKSSAPPVGAIVGGVVGGVIVLVVLVCGLGWVLFKKRQARRDARVGEMQGAGRVELPYGYAPQELGTGMVVYKQHAAVEVEQPPVELAGMELRDDRERWTK